MSISTTPLGMNARNFLYIRPYNRRRYKLIADDKLRTKELLTTALVPTTGLIAKFRSFDDVRSFDWTSLPREFVLKPALGYGGQGITVVRSWNGETGKNNDNEVVTIDMLESELFGILDGAYSLNNVPDAAFIEERVKNHPFYKKHSYGGVADIRVIVFNRIPVMAMLRLPTVYSDGKANLHMGAVGLGIDMRTGITTYGVTANQQVQAIPGKKTKVRGIKIPNWQRCLSVAVAAQQVSKLGFVGIDLVLGKDDTPLVLEVNARPGLSIQLANNASLRTRLERITSMEISTDERGVEVAQSLFADPGLQDLEVSDKTLGVIEKVTVFGPEKKKTIRAKIDTGAYRTSLDVELVRELGLDEDGKWYKVKAGSGRQRRRSTDVRFKLRDREIQTTATYTKRSHMRFPMIIGRRDLAGFLVDPARLPEGRELK